MEYPRHLIEAEKKLTDAFRYLDRAEKTPTGNPADVASRIELVSAAKNAISQANAMLGRRQTP